MKRHSSLAHSSYMSKSMCNSLVGRFLLSSKLNLHEPSMTKTRPEIVAHNPFLPIVSSYLTSEGMTGAGKYCRDFRPHTYRVTICLIPRGGLPC